MSGQRRGRGQACSALLRMCLYVNIKKEEIQKNLKAVYGILQNGLEPKLATSQFKNQVGDTLPSVSLRVSQKVPTPTPEHP